MIRTEDIPDDLDGDVLRLMRSRGDSLQAPRNLDFAVMFPDEAAAIAFCQQIGSSELQARYQKLEDADDLSWDVTVSKYMVPHHHDILALERRLQALASPLHGEVDGWNCVNVPDMPPA